MISVISFHLKKTNIVVYFRFIRLQLICIENIKNFFQVPVAKASLRLLNEDSKQFSVMLGVYYLSLIDKNT